MFILSETRWFILMEWNFIYLKWRIREIKQIKFWYKIHSIFRRISISIRQIIIKTKYFSYFSCSTNARVLFEQWKANIIKTKFRKFPIHKMQQYCKHRFESNILWLTRVSPWIRNERDPFFSPCTSHLCKFLAELTFEDHPSVWSSDHMDSNISTLTFIQLITNSERIWDYSASVDNSFREWEFKRWEFEFNAVRKGKRREEKKRFKLHCESEQIIVQTWIIRSFTFSLIVRAKLCAR